MNERDARFGYFTASKRNAISFAHRVKKREKKKTREESIKGKKR